MVQFNKLEINKTGDELLIDVSVKDLQYYTNVYIDSIYIDTQNTFKSGGPSGNVVYSKTINGSEKSVILKLSKYDLNASITDNMLFVWVKTKGVPSPDVPCGMDNSLVLGVTLYTYNIYCNMLKTLNLEYNNSCSIPKKFIDKYLQYKALQYALITEQYNTAIDYYNNIIRPNKNISTNTVCRCYGK